MTGTACLAAASHRAGLTFPAWVQTLTSSVLEVWTAQHAVHDLCAIVQSCTGWPMNASACEGQGTAAAVPDIWNVSWGRNAALCRLTP